MRPVGLVALLAACTTAVDLPEFGSKHTGRQRRVVVTILLSGETFFDGRRMTPTQRQAALSRAARAAGEVQRSHSLPQSRLFVLIRADAAVRFRAVTEVIEECVAADVFRIQLAVAVAGGEAEVDLFTPQLDFNYDFDSADEVFVSVHVVARPGGVRYKAGDRTMKHLPAVLDWAKEALAEFTKADEAAHPEPDIDDEDGDFGQGNLRRVPKTRVGEVKAGGRILYGTVVDVLETLADAGVDQLRVFIRSLRSRTAPRPRVLRYPGGK